MTKVSLNPKTKEITIKELIIKNDEVFDFIYGKSNKEDWIKRALIVGSVGLKNMLLEVNVDYIDKRFDRFLADVEDKFKTHAGLITEKLDDVFSLKKKDSAVSILYKKIEDTFDETNKKSPISKLTKQLEDYFDDKNGTVKKIIDETFNPERKDSPMSKFIDNLDMYFDENDGVIKKTIDKTFDINKRGTPLYLLLSTLETYFDKDNGSLTKLMNQTFDFDNKNSMTSKLAKLLDENFDVDKGKIKVLLDPNKKDMPIYQLKEEIMGPLRFVQDKLTEYITKEKIEEKTPIKGRKFEDELETQLQFIANPYEDNIKSVKNKLGKKKKKVGDFVVLVNGNEEQKIVIEAKNSDYSVKAIENELRDAMENRGANFGIFITKTQDQLPKSMQPAKILKDRIVTSFENNGLFFAYRVARMFIQNELYKKPMIIPIETIQTEVQNMLGYSKDFEEMLKKTHDITNATSFIESQINVLNNRFKIGLSKIESLLK